ncbi:MAG: hypothetical protein ACMUIP_01790 [bacterium]
MNYRAFQGENIKNENVKIWCCALLIVLFIIISFVIGCADIPSRLDMDYGCSYRQSKLNQIIDPNAGNNAAPVIGFDGQAALKTLEKYMERTSEENTRSESMIESD